MLITSKDANKNYLAKVVELKNIRKHENADRLRIVSIDFQDVVIGEGLQEGDICVYFPVEATINTRFLSFTNSFRDAKINEDLTTKGYFESNGRVRAVKLRGEKSCGCLFPIEELEKFVGEVFNKTNLIGFEFDYYDDILICEKYVVPVKTVSASWNGKTGKTSKLSKIVENQWHFHADTENFRKNYFKVKPEDEISISYKVHGCVFHDTKIETMEYGVKTIKEIVDNKIDCHIKSYDIINQEIIYSKIDEYYFLEDDGEWYEIELDDGRLLKITSNNPVWLPELNCYR